MDETTPLQGANGRILAGRYALRGLIGQGGMAEVELASDLVLDRQVAVKILHAHYASDPAFLARFRREAQAAASMNHPNVVAVYDTGEDDARPFIVMEYVSGRSLRDVLRVEQLLPERAAEIAGDAALGLHYAHERGLVHRDVKPGNILISDDGQVKVADFGIARAVNAETVTQTAAVFGTAAYVAPEQAQGAPVDRRTDVYALGCVLYEMLTGRQPFTGDSAVALAYKHVSEAPVTPSAYDDAISPQLDAVVLKAMAKAPDDRYQTAREFGADLQRATAGLGVAAPAPPPVVYEETRALQRDRTAPSPTAPPLERDRYVTEERTRSSRGIGYAILALLLLAVFVAAGFLLTRLLTTETVNQLQVPNVVGQDLNAASQLLRAQGFTIGTLEQVQDPEAPPNTVIATDPEPLSLAPEGAAVNITMSTGPPLVAVPEVVGLPVDEAEARLREDGFSIGPRSEQPSEDQPEGIVLGADPDPGAEVPQGFEVSLTVSSGAATVTLPSAVDRTFDDAVSLLQNACPTPPCVQIDRIDAFSEDIQEGRVISQTPEAGSEVAIGSTVALRVSRGPEQVEPTPTPEPTTEPTPTPTPEETE